MACVDVPALPLQLLLARHPDWTKAPAVVVDRDKPTGVILWANERARASRVLPGMRYAAGLSLASDLRAAEVGEKEIEDGVTLICDRLRRFSPEVEPAEEDPGVFWVNASGLGGLFESLSEWGRWLVGDLAEARLECNVAVGFTRFGTYAAAKAGHAGGEQRVVVFESAPQEHKAARRVRLEALDIDPRLRDTLDKLGVRTVGQFLRLPATGIRRRFGAEAYRLHKMAVGETTEPFAPRPAEQPLERHADLDHAERSSGRLLFLIKRMLDPLLSACAARHEALTALVITCKLERHDDRVERIRTAEPTLDARQILGLVHLRLESVDLPSGVEELELRVESVRATTEQLRLFAQQPRRNLRSAAEAFARIRAEFGDRAVVRARLLDAHLPEASFAWEVLSRLTPPDPKERDTEQPVMVRRVFARPVQLPPRSRHEPDGWLLRGEEHGHVVKYIGPYVVSGGWWVSPVHREYHFAQTRDGELVWIYYDKKRRRWYMQGMVE